MGSKKPRLDGGAKFMKLLPQRDRVVGRGMRALVLQRGGDEALEQGVGAVRAALELGVELCTEVEVAPRNLDRLDKAAVRAGAGNDKALLLKLGAERIV